MNLPPIKINAIAIWKIYRAIRKFLRQQKVNAMCFKKWFSKPDPVTAANKRAILFAINDYPGSQNDLNGCVNDQMDLEKKLKSDFPGFEIIKFKDSEVTRKCFIDQIVQAISVLRSGDVLLLHYSGHGTYTYDSSGDESDGYDEAVYLYDGMVIDDDIGEALKAIPEGATVLLLFDSCFSGTVTREIVNFKNRFVPSKDSAKPLVKRRRFAKSEMNWMVFSGCGEHQTSADSYFSGRYNGAFTYYALKTLKPGITYREWFTAIHRYLPSSEYDQDPTLEGNESLFDKKVFT